MVAQTFVVLVRLARAGWGVKLVGSSVLALMLVVLVGAVDGRTAWAATHVVTSSGDSGPGSLREAIASAATGDTISFDIPDDDDSCSGGECVITLTSGQLSIDKDLAIVGPGAGLVTIARSDASSTPAFRIFWIAQNRTVTMSGLKIENGFVVGGNSGGGIFNAGTLTLTNMLVIRNEAEGSDESSGGGIANAGTMTLSHTFVIENSATGLGGGIASNGPLTISNANIWWNTTTDGGRGGGLMFGQDTTVTNSLFLENEARSDDSEIPTGGAIYGQAGTLRLSNSTISGNRSNRSGGGLVSADTANVDVSNVTFNNNTATRVGRTIAHLGTGTVTVRNSIVMKAAGDTAGQSCTGSITLAGNNISDDGSCGMTTGDARLGALADNGGFTQTYGLGAGSAAINAGDTAGCKDHSGQPLTTDVRGVPRPQGGICDLGALEAQTSEIGSAAPIIIANASIITVEDTQVTPRIALLLYDTDVSEDAADLLVTATSNNTDLLADDGINVVQVNSSGSVRTLSVMPRPQKNGTATITLRVQDGNGQTSSTSVAVNVLPVNDAPNFASGPVQVTVLEDSGAYSQPWATTITTGPANESDQPVTFDVTNNLASLFTVQPSISSNGTLSFTPAANANGTATVIVVLRDSGGTANGGVDRTLPRQFSLTVTPVNDRPTFEKGTDVTVQVGGKPFSQSSWAQAMVAGPPNESGQVLSFQVAANDLTLFAVQPAISSTGTLTFTPAANAQGSTTVSAVLRDDGGSADGGTDTSMPATFTVTITPPNKPPTAKDDSFAVGFNTALTVNAPGVLANDTDPEGQQLHAIKVKEPLHGSLTLNPNGSFSYTPTAGYSGSDSFTYKANDSSLDSEAVTVSLTVAAAPAPVRCVPAPNPTVRTEQTGAGRLKVTVTAQTNAGLPINALGALVFGAARNARVEVAGQSAGTTAHFPLTLPAGTQQTTFYVQRVAPGDFKVDLGIVDGCHDADHPFRTFVGGGTGVQ